MIGKASQHQLATPLQLHVARVRLHGSGGDRPPARLCRPPPASEPRRVGAATAHIDQGPAAIHLVRLRLRRTGLGLGLGLGVQA